MATLIGFRPYAEQAQVDNNIHTVNLDVLGDALFEDREASSNIPGGFDTISLGSQIQQGLTLPGVHSTGYADDWYNKIHLIPPVADFQNVFGSIVKDMILWNAFRVPQTLSGITYPLADAVELNFAPLSLPATFGALLLVNYTAQFLSSAPPIVDTDAIMHFTGVDSVLRVTGRRITLWPSIPETGNNELLEWKTDILQAFSSEQRLALRQAPRQQIEYSYRLDQREFSIQKAISSGSPNRVYAIPYWNDAIYLDEVFPGQSVINADFINYEFANGSLAIIFDNDGNNHISEISALSDTQLTLRSPLLLGSKQAYIVPLKLAKSYTGPSFGRSHNLITDMQVKFTVIEDRNFIKDTALILYRGVEVLTERYAVESSLSEKLNYQLDIFDNESGIVDVDIQRSLLRNLQTVGFIKQEINSKRILRSWIMRRKGKLKPFWLPSWNRDVDIVLPVLSDSLAITINYIAYTSYFTVKDLMILLKNGTQLFVRVIGSTHSEGAGSEALNLSAEIGTAFSPSDVELACFVTHCRLDNDLVTIKHGDAGVMRTSLSVIEVPE